MFRIVLALIVSFTLFSFAHAQETTAPVDPLIRAQQNMQQVLSPDAGMTADGVKPLDPRADAGLGDPLSTVVGDKGGVNLWKAVPQASIWTRASNHGPAAKTLIQDGGISWWQTRRGPLLKYGGLLLLGTLLLLTLFYLFRGRIRLDGEWSGRRILRFRAVERFAHWLAAGSFILLGLTGLIVLFGRTAFIPVFGHEAYATVAEATKWIHNNVSWAFMLSLVMMFVMWVAQNIPSRRDIEWIMKGGGLFSEAHAPAKKFNAGQKIIFWSVMILGTSISVTGLALLFPFEINLFGGTFGALNNVGISGVLGLGELPTALSPQEEMQWSQLWHAIASFILMAIIFGHIYIGTLGMEGAFDAMNSGEVDEQWAREHHALWLEEVEAKRGEAPAGAVPAE